MLEKAQLFYFENRHRFSPFIFVASFCFDLYMVRRPDTFDAMLFMCAHVALSLVLLLLFARSAEGDTGRNHGARRWKPLAKLWLEMVMQFSFGALASVLFVSYVKGSDFIMSLPFLALLALFLFGNEFAHDHRQRLSLRFSATLFLIYAYLLYFVPLVRDVLGFGSLAISTGAAFGIALFMTWAIRRVAPNVFARVRGKLVGFTLALLLGIPALIGLGMIPPLPLSMREATVVHHIARVDATSYGAEVEAQPFYLRMGLPFIAPTYHVRQGGGLTFYTAIYAPADIHTTILHKWERYDDKTHSWKEIFTSTLTISGGRSNGYRTYTTNSSIEEGKWRVTASLGTGQVLGHRTFNVAYGEPMLTEEMK